MNDQKHASTIIGITRPQSELQREMQTLRDKLAGLESTVTDLTQRLSPITRSEPPTGKSINEDLPPVDTEFAGEMREVSIGIRSTTLTLRDLISRLAV